MSEYNQDKLTQDVSPRSRRRPTAPARDHDPLVKHIHAFAREVDLTPEEWLAGLNSSTTLGQISTERARSSSCCPTRSACR